MRCTALAHARPTPPLTLPQGELVMVLSNYVVLVYILGPWTQWNTVGIVNGVLFQTVVCLVFVAHWRAMFVCPGVTQLNSVRARLCGNQCTASVHRCAHLPAAGNPG